jgi:hypothetical protein
MTGLILGLALMALLANGVFLFGLVWLKVERNQKAREEAIFEAKSQTHFPWYMEQAPGTVTFTVGKQDVEAMSGRGR